MSPKNTKALVISLKYHEKVFLFHKVHSKSEIVKCKFYLFVSQRLVYIHIFFIDFNIHDYKEQLMKNLVPINKQHL